jgi:hypothetical protein
MKTKLLALLLVLPLSGAAYAETKKCKISVVGGSFKGHSMKVKMKDGKFVGDSSIRDSTIAGCRGMKYFYGRWYHLCPKGTLIVFKQKKGKWVKLKPRSLKKYVHNCF